MKYIGKKYRAQRIQYEVNTTKIFSNIFTSQLESRSNKITSCHEKVEIRG